MSFSDFDRFGAEKCDEAVQDFRKLVVWRKAHALTVTIYRVTKQFPNDEKFGLTSQIRRAAASVAANLAEGCGRGGDGDFSRFVQIAMGSANEVEYHLLLARDLGYLPPQNHIQLDQNINAVKRMLVSLLRTLKNPSHPNR